MKKKNEQNEINVNLTITKWVKINLLYCLFYSDLFTIYVTVEDLFDKRRYAANTVVEGIEKA